MTYQDRVVPGTPRRRFDCRTIVSTTLFVSLFVALSGCTHNSGGGAAAVNPGPKKPALPPAAAAVQPAVLSVEKPKEGVRAIHVTGWIAGLKHHFGDLVGLIDRTELNAVVIDINDDGYVTYNVAVPLAKETGSSQKMVADMDKLMALLKEHNIYPIARITCFRDQIVPKKHPEMAVQRADGSVWKDPSGHTWLNPYSQKSQDYIVDIALDAVKHGFKEIQFDYVRFPSEGKISNLKYPGKPANGLRKDQIEAFITYARGKIKGAGADFSADVFGLTSLVEHDMGIGQTRTNVAKHVDYLCPMVYPSHYAKGEYGIPDPNKEPYRIVKLSVADAQKRLKDIPTCKLRPWLQDFSLYGVHYGPNQVKAQFKAIHDLGINEFILWNARCRYTEAALEKAPKT